MSTEAEEKKASYGYSYPLEAFLFMEVTRWPQGM
jgi:hypothetical protein